MSTTSTTTSALSISALSSTTPATYTSLSIPTITNLVTVKLTDDNFLLWSHQIEAFLYSQNLLRFVHGSLPCPAADPDHELWVRTDKTLISIISPPLSEPILASIIGCTTSGSIWTLIKEHFSQKSVANSSLYHKRLNDLSHSTRPVSNYLQEAKSIADALAAIGEPVSNKDLVNAVLCGLGSEFDMLVTAFETFDTLPQFSMLRSRLLNFEARHKTLGEPTPSAFLASQSSSPAFNNSGDRNNSRNKGKRYKYNGRPQQPRPTTTAGILGSSPVVHPSPAMNPCQLCLGFGHGARSCPQLSSFAHPSAPNSLHSEFAGLQIAPIPSSQAYHSNSSHSYSPHQPYDSAWYPDTGNMALPIGSSSFRLNNVYVIPSMRKNLLSIAQFCKDNHVLCAFDSRHFYIFDLPTGSLLYQGLCRDGLYKLPTLPPHLQALFASLQSSHLWHNRLGHPSSKLLRLTVSSSNIGADLPLATCPHSDCCVSDPSPSPALVKHPMVTRNQDGTRQQRVRTDCAVKYPLPSALLVQVSSSPEESTDTLQR
ncbi:hypothetical protein Vadar_020343 [Vaccinium darrowii]|uniref:Uncharacterized protein n=1 Tax=Vaccinium darrowii TaxID=229202 RepID=A0ACB7Z5Q2_9ERIC|nr:hypothetical protein Vadar_020343 [Vaccinium darrowii]